MEEDRRKARPPGQGAPGASLTMAGEAPGYTPEGAWAGRAHALDTGELDDALASQGDTETSW